MFFSNFIRFTPKTALDKLLFIIQKTNIIPRCPEESPCRHQKRTQLKTMSRRQQQQELMEFQLRTSFWCFLACFSFIWPRNFSYLIFQLNKSVITLRISLLLLQYFNQFSEMIIHGLDVVESGKIDELSRGIGAILLAYCAQITPKYCSILWLFGKLQAFLI